MPQQQIAFPFNVQEIGSAVNRAPNLYSRIGQMGIYDRRPQTSTSVTLIYQDNKVVLLDPVARGGQRQETNRTKPDGITFDIPHFAFGDVLTPTDIQGFTAFRPGPARGESMAEAYDRRLRKTRLPHDQTFEFYRMGGIKGVILNPDGTTMYNLFNELGITQKTIDFDFSNANADIMGKIEELEDHISLNLRGETSTGYHVMCDPGWLRKLKFHPKYEKYLLSHSAALQQLAASRQNAVDPNPARTLKIESVTFESYNAVGTNSAGADVPFIAANEGHAFPLGTMEMFQEYDAPANRMDAVNMAPSDEIAVYVKELDQSKGIDMDTESNKLCICERPEALVKLTAS